MSDLPELIVEHPAHAYASGVIRIDGPLPTVTQSLDQAPQSHRDEITRPLRVEDRVILATDDCECRSCMYGNHPHPFATATVAKIDGPDGMAGDFHYFVTVTNVEAL